MLENTNSMPAVSGVNTNSPAGFAERQLLDFDWQQEEGGARSLLVQYANAVVRRRWLLLAIILLTLAAGAVRTLLETPLYSASSEIDIRRTTRNLAKVPGSDSLESQDNYETEFYETQYNLLKTRALALRVVRKLNLTDSASFYSAHGATKPVLASAADRDRAQDAAAGMLLGRVKINPVRNASLVYINYTCESAEWAAKLANGWADEYVASNMDREFSSNADARRFLESKLTELRTKLQQSESMVLSFAASRGMVKLGGGVGSDGKGTAPHTLVESDLEALNTALQAARAERITAQSKLGTNPVARDDGNNSGSSLRSRRDDLVAQYAQILVKFEPNYPTARALKAQIDALDAAIARETGRAAGTAKASIQSAYSEAVAREEQLSRQVQVLKEKLDQQQKDAIQYSIYQRDADTNRQLYDAMLQRYKEVGLAGSVGSSNVAIVEAARAPGAPSSPNMTRNLMLAFVVGIGICAIVIFGLEQVDDRIRDPSEVDRKLGVPLLGSAPLSALEPEEALANTKSDLSEAYFSLATLLSFATSHGMPRNVVVISSQPGEGKSTTSLALAQAIGRTGKKVLLIDSDLRSPSVHALVHIENTAGFSNHLTGDDNFAAHVRETPMRGVWALPSGPLPPSAAELLVGERLPHVLARFNESFDCLVIDGPPVIGLADAPLIGRAVEGVIFVVEADSTGLGAIRNAMKRVRDVGAHMFGVVVTKVNSDRFGYGYSYEYDSESGGAKAGR